MRKNGDYVPIAVYDPFGPYDEKGRPYWKVVTKLAHKTSGAVIKRTARANSAAEADDLRAEVLKLLQEGFEPAVKTVTLGDLLDLWRSQEETTKPLTPNRRCSIRGLESSDSGIIESSRFSIRPPGLLAHQTVPSSFFF